MARPSKYTEDIPARLEDMMRQGYSIQEVCLELGICKQTLYNWTQEHPELLDAKKNGEWFSEGWWMKAGREALKDRDFNYTGWYMNMKNRFGWSDKQAIEHSGASITITVDKDAKKGLDELTGNE
jgi:hypothetical protein